MQKKPASSTMIIFGATGDLARRKILPALYRLQTLDMLPDNFHIVGYATRNLSSGDYKKFVSDALQEFVTIGPLYQEAVEKFISNIHFISASFDDISGFDKLSDRLAAIDASVPTEKLYYLATPPSFFSIIVKMLKNKKMSTANHGECPPKLVIEKPFGRDLESAIKLNDLILQCFDEKQVYRIDHYLGKETVQNILFFRFANGIYEPIWNRRYIDHVQIIVAESIGVENRGKYFEEAGMLRDMVQNHMLQLLSLVAMEPPVSMEADTVRSKKIELLQSIQPIEPEDVQNLIVRGQYGRSDGNDGNDGKINSYKEENNVSQDSKTETFVALKVMVDNWRWSGVPFFLRTGKRLKKRVSEISIFFKDVPLCLFPAAEVGCPPKNMLTLKIQPDEGITFQFNAKHPGSSNNMEVVEMDFSYTDSFKGDLPEAYERLIYDCMMGDSTLFPHKDGIEASWNFITKIHEGWMKFDPEVHTYDPGSWGPKAAEKLISRNDKEWKNL